ncbi:MAG: bifunctional phosphoribosyl-AMP cyclohydrolase/phosphoribosyl-ATP diphosphatase HisIE [Pyrinomonadaceae bacterium]|nr:bifunctional phosphoribosyl-AMP cyclohydrolase/phosphoribosyl-ATP diphosphatase HisIE [Acidobacteriota bacterium]
MNMKLQFDKYADGLVPAIVQDAVTDQILMLGFMNEAAFAKTRESGLVAFYSRSRQRLWTKGETSGNFLRVAEMFTDCDNDTLLIKATLAGPVCHTGAQTCFEGDTLNKLNRNILFDLEKIIEQRHTNPDQNSYTSKLFSKGINKIAQKVGEEAVELVIEAKDNHVKAFKSEAADLLFHFLVLLRAKEVTLDDVLAVLSDRRKVENS